MNDERVYIGPNSRFTGLYRPIFTKRRVYIGPFPEVTSKAQIPTGLYRPNKRVYIGPSTQNTGLYRTKTTIHGSISTHFRFFTGLNRPSPYNIFGIPKRVAHRAQGTKKIHSIQRRLVPSASPPPTPSAPLPPLRTKRMITLCQPRFGVGKKCHQLLD